MAILTRRSPSPYPRSLGAITPAGHSSKLNRPADIVNRRTAPTSEVSNALRSGGDASIVILPYKHQGQGIVEC